MKNITFELTEDEFSKFETWKKELPKLPIIDVWGKEFQFTYSFRPTGLGVAKFVERSDGEKLDLTNYSNW